ncbi:MAG: bifunctional 4-hydroxy-2-oxoglutarate aldolase/2-dehydro-3-deoxy-phosphogluconate aldolase [bacterium]
MQSDDFLDELRRLRAVAILRTDRKEAAGPAMEAAVRGGFRALEFTLNTPGALERIAEFAARDGLLVGAGTVLTTAQARDAVAAGACFLVSPVADPEVIDTARELGVAAIPGCATPSEMLRAHRAGAPLVKLFPGPPDTPTYVRQILGPLPFLRIVPTSGVDGNNAAATLEAGAWAVGFVSCLFDAQDLAADRFDRVEARARDLLAATAAAKIE